MQRQDRRTQKTHKALAEAFVSLIGEKPYDSIVIKEILDRANVGRSTFYTHYRDKDDLLLKCMHEMLGPIPSPVTQGKYGDRILWFSLPVFEHHHRHAHAWGDRIGNRGRAILHEHLRRVLTGIIAEAMKIKDRPRPPGEQTLPAELVSANVASTFVLVLNWWLDKGMPLTPREINKVFRRLADPALAIICR